MFKLVLYIDWLLPAKRPVESISGISRPVGFLSKHRLFEIIIWIIWNATGCFWPVKDFLKMFTFEIKVYDPIYLTNYCLHSNQQRMFPIYRMNTVREGVFDSALRLNSERALLRQSSYIKILNSQTDHRHKSRCSSPPPLEITIESQISGRFQFLLRFNK